MAEGPLERYDPIAEETALALARFYDEGSEELTDEQRQAIIAQEEERRTDALAWSELLGGVVEE